MDELSIRESKNGKQDKYTFKTHDFVDVCIEYNHQTTDLKNGTYLRRNECQDLDTPSNALFKTGTVHEIRF